MRRLIQAAAVTAAFGIVLGQTPFALAAHDKGEWWFNSWHIEEQVWPQTKGAGITVAVLDTGVNASLPGLKDAVVPGTDFAGGDGRRDQDTDSSTGGHGTAMASFIASSGKGTGYMGVAPSAKILPIFTGETCPRRWPRRSATALTTAPRS